MPKHNNVYHIQLNYYIHYIHLHLRPFQNKIPADSKSLFPKLFFFWRPLF